MGLCSHGLFSDEAQIEIPGVVGDEEVGPGAVGHDTVDTDTVGLDPGAYGQDVVGLWAGCWGRCSGPSCC